jgi:hypothetical protein
MIQTCQRKMKIGGPDRGVRFQRDGRAMVRVDSGHFRLKSGQYMFKDGEYTFSLRDVGELIDVELGRLSKESAAELEKTIR